MIGLGWGLVFCGLVGLILLGFPIAFAFAAAVLGIALLTGRDIAMVVPTAFWQTGAFALLALPLFIAAGAIMRDAKISDRLVDFIESLTGRSRAKPGTVTVIGCMLFGAISGSGAAAIAAMGSVMIPRMRAAGYDHGYATALVACSSVLALLIPPSIPMIVFCLASGISVSAAFLSTVVPGVLVGLIYIAMNRRYAARLAAQSEARAARPAARLTLGQTVGALPALAMPLLMLAGIYGGAFTPTEAAAVVFVYAIAIGLLLYRTLTLKGLATTLAEAARITASIIAILFFLLIFGQLLSMEGVPRSIADTITSVSGNYYFVLFAINVALFVIGMIIDDVSGSILAAVILLPVANSAGVDPLHFAAIVGVTLGLGNITPPTAPLLFVASSVSRLELRCFMAPAVRFMLFGHLPVVVLVTYVPSIALALPGWLLAR